MGALNWLKAIAAIAQWLAVAGCYSLLRSSQHARQQPQGCSASC